jgi:hypothetical protein
MRRENQMEGQDVKQEVAVTTPRPPVKFGVSGFSVNTLEEAYRFGQYVVKAGFFPALDAPEKVVVTMQLAADNRVSFSLLAGNIAFINKRACMYGDALIGIAHANGGMSDFEETLEGKDENMTATCRIIRKGIVTPIVRTFSMRDAKAAQLLGKDPWQKYPKRMLAMRARSWALRDAGLVQGIIAREEAEDITPMRPAPAFPEKSGVERLADRLKAPEPPIIDVTPEPTPSEPAMAKAAAVESPGPCAKCKGVGLVTGCPECGEVLEAKGDAFEPPTEPPKEQEPEAPKHDPAAPITREERTRLLGLADGHGITIPMLKEIIKDVVGENVPILSLNHGQYDEVVAKVEAAKK